MYKEGKAMIGHVKDGPMDVDMLDVWGVDVCFGFCLCLCWHTLADSIAPPGRHHFIANIWSARGAWSEDPFLQGRM